MKNQHLFRKTENIQMDISYLIGEMIEEIDDLESEIQDLKEENETLNDRVKYLLTQIDK